MTEPQPREAERRATFILARAEKRLLPRIAASLPRWVSPDLMTAIGVLGSTLIALGYILSTHDRHWLWLASGGLIVNWFGDSLDGTLARVRKIERPRYGFYLDHLTDAYSTTLIGLGLGFSPYMLLSVGLAIVIAYLILSINVYLETHVFGVFRYGYGILGPTEARGVLFLLNTAALVIGPIPFVVWGIRMTVFDLAGIAAALSMGGLLLRRVVRNLRELSRMEPPGR
ncbi:MAG TPA: CDP-alcohol phosphatidyltransferase family protein [Candidatus Limnocylindrales bacterium]|nr:CDP-alcohol phosphatidyltransferase family protein [Candidatus Limnocylindrales bacterium]